MLAFLRKYLNDWLYIMIRGPSQLSQQTGAGGIISGLIGEDYSGSGCQMSPGRGLVETQALATLATDGGLVETQTRGREAPVTTLGELTRGLLRDYRDSVT